jgi:hypothetical protein
VTIKPPSGGPSTGPDQRRDADKGHSPHQIGFFYRPKQDQAADRHHHRPAQSLHDSGDDQSGQRSGASAANRAQGEDHDRGTENPPRTEPIGGPAADRNKNGEAQ